ncbi:excinuclease ABC subunit UvrA [Candidatus Synchoanobacter obligatus]|uniref:UvrABC system protein A n=1 Tax=Candidatus Synchoanobacter obligatus TaxID=2919597 RepID=A0ABT1L690_9GAMM|nr:excinuclease ABC subunit UvrA [Candidatus Synchoanobacter obligatus]MCP8352398.1 excinuclease ABC subunit UvrA [Candidatus Synchoanobacter obligatus]
MTESNIIIRGAKTHNLNIPHLSFPRNQLVVITGPSGSGKSSLALKTIYAEGQRRYVGSLSTYARQFLSVMDKPDVESIEGLSPAISIEQKAGSHNPRSTVGTITEIYDYVRLLFARIGIPHCPTHKSPLKAMSVSQIVDTLLSQNTDEKIHVLAPVVEDQKGAHETLLTDYLNQGYIRIRLNGEVMPIDQANIDPSKKNSIDIVMDRLKVNPDNTQRLSESIEMASNVSKGRIIITTEDDETLYSTQHACHTCGWSISQLEPKMFSFNSPTGACSHCDGLGMRRYISEEAIIINPILSIGDGAIWHWDKQHKHYYAILLSVCEYYDIDIHAPWKSLDKEHQKIILYGTGTKRIPLNYPNIYGKMVSRIRRFDGVIPVLEKRYEETDSESVKESLAKLIAYDQCQSCHGSRLSDAARYVTVSDTPLPTVIQQSIEDLNQWIKSLNLTEMEQNIAEKIITEISNRSQFLLSVGLDYLSLNRAAETLSGGEAQRIRLASQIGSGLVGVMYVLDEPSIGLHMRDNQRLIDTLIHLRDLGNSVIVVEHDEEIMRQADLLIDIGPGAGIHGGQVTAQGHIDELINHPNSLTGDYLTGKATIPVPSKRITPKDQWVEIIGATCNNLKAVHAKIPLGLITCVSGVSGSGKSSLINDTLYPAAYNHFNRTHHHQGPCDTIKGFEHLDKVIDIDQSPIGRTPRSNPATYTGIFTLIRDLFSQTEEARSRGYQPGRFSFNVKGGRCEACSGDGLIKVEMHFLSDVYVQCDLCEGSRFNRETLSVYYKEKNIAQVLDLTVDEATTFFKPIPRIYKKLKTLQDVGLGYIKLGQSATTLSGGEAQRIKLARELSKRSTGQTLFILDEPTTGLHFHDIKKLVHVLEALRNQGNTVIVIEHNIDVIKVADWIIDIGPEGGHRGGTIVAEGTPETVAKSKKSHTAPYLKAALK